MSTILGTREIIHTANYCYTSPQELSFPLSLDCMQLNLLKLQTTNLPYLLRRGEGLQHIRSLANSSIQKCLLTLLKISTEFYGRQGRLFKDVRLKSNMGSGWTYSNFCTLIPMVTFY